jgi:preprotein translocase subunit SecG
MRTIAIIALVLLSVATIHAGGAVFRRNASWLFPERSAGQATRIFAAAIAALLVAALITTVVLLSDRYFSVAEKMTWQCAPDQYQSWAPLAQPVRFRYLENPQYEEVASGKGLCDELKGSGRNVVLVEFAVWGNSFQGLRGFREVSVDGKPIINVGGSGYSGAYGSDIGPHPLQKFFSPSRFDALVRRLFRAQPVSRSRSAPALSH